uniref:NADH dehydrogenase subunit 4L n=1 Tax=Musculium lacustre TaxID=98299 RepID=UPI0022386271|nr:NADH dehydrogenase subunit 4L [Musculium lacustre]UYR45711.1 NADH dehydrogenase subunit 4L [Musculium lacustre]UYR45724.1 NADH dehydrogenase subunit 4L [Musculium lacustre]
MLLMMCFLLFFCSLLIFCLHNEHFLSSLIILEMVMVTFLGSIVMIMFFEGNTNILYTSSFLLSFSVCHAAIGLGVLVGVIRFKGISGVKSFSLMKF